MKHLFCAAAAAAVLLAAPAAQAAVIIDFDSLAAPGFAINVADGYEEDGLVFNSATPGYLFTWGTGLSYNADPDGAVMSVITDNMPLIVKAADGGTFDLLSFDLSSGWNDKSGGSVPFTYTDATGTHSSALQLDKAVGLQTFTLNLTGLTQFTLKGMRPTLFQVDNIVVDFAVSAVPEPATWAMMIAGFGLAGAALRRTRRSAVA